MIPSTIKGIENYAFAFCNNLTSVELPDGLTEISGSTFYNCSKLESLVIPSSVIYTGYDATYKCYKLKIILYKGTPEDWQNIEMKKNSDCSSVYQIPLCTAKRYYYSETLPVDNGNYWHYVDGVPTIWE